MYVAANALQLVAEIIQFRIVKIRRFQIALEVFKRLLPICDVLLNVRAHALVGACNAFTGIDLRWFCRLGRRLSRRSLACGIRPGRCYRLRRSSLSTGYGQQRGQNQRQCYGTLAIYHRLPQSADVGPSAVC